MNKKVIVLIDGSNFYFKLKDLKLKNLLNFNFAAFCEYLAQPDTLVLSKYYIGAVKTDTTEKMDKQHADQQRLLTHLKKNKFTYELGYLLKSGGKFHEKGVDVHIAVDILVNSYENLADKIILISSDSDLIPAVNQAIKLGKAVEYVGFSHQPSVALVSKCTTSRLLTKTDLQKFTL